MKKFGQLHVVLCSRLGVIWINRSGEILNYGNFIFVIHFQLSLFTRKQGISIKIIEPIECQCIKKKKITRVTELVLLSRDGRIVNRFLDPETIFQMHVKCVEFFRL